MRQESRSSQVLLTLQMGMVPVRIQDSKARAQACAKSVAGVNQPNNTKRGKRQPAQCNAVGTGQ